MRSNRDHKIQGNLNYISRMRSSVEDSYRRMMPYCNNSAKVVQQFCGKYYGEGQTAERVSLPMIENAATIYSQHLAGRTPTVNISTQYEKLKGQAAAFELAMQRLLEEIMIGITFRRSVRSALFSMGVVKTGINRIGAVELLGEFIDVGQPYAQHISINDTVLDMNAKKIEHVQYIGNKYRVPYEELMDSGFIEASQKDFVTPSDPEDLSKFHINTQIKSNSKSNVEEYKKTVELWDIWSPLDNAIFTMQFSNGDERFFKAVDYDGPEGGPYHLLGFNEVEDRIIPLAPGLTWLHIHNLANALMNKAGDQAQRQKTITGYLGAATKDAQAVQEAGDGDMIQMLDPKAVQEYRFGGADQTNLAFKTMLESDMNRYAGNLDLLGGLGPQSATLGQDQLLAGSANKRMDAMMHQVRTHYKKVIEHIAYYVWNDPLYDPELMYRVPGTDLEMPVSFSPEDRERGGDFVQYNFDIEPYSMVDDSPSVKAAKLMQVVQQVMPVMPMMQQQGISLDFKALLGKLGKYMNLQNDLPEILTYVDQPTEPPIGNDRVHSPAVTTRNNVRTSRTEATEQGRRDMQQRAFSAGADSLQENERIKVGM